MRRLSMAAVSAVLLTLVAGAFPIAAAASSQAPRDGSVCRTEYQAGGWDVQPCLVLNSSTFTGLAGLLDHPSNCAGYRIYLVDAATGKLVQSTSLRPCGEVYNEVTADASRFTKLRAFARFQAFNSSGGSILSLDSPALTYG